MSNSSLVTVKVPAYSGNYTKGRTSKISEITIHHMAGVLTAKQCGAIFQKVGRKGSAHYGVGNDGSIGLYVNECDTAWANSNWQSNCRAVTIETSNSSTGGNWAVGDKALNSLIKLVADIAKRNGLGKLVKGKNLTWHRMYAATTCPGDYLLSKMDYIIEQANKINYPEIAGAKVSGWSCTVKGFNEPRTTDSLVVYINPQTKTGTNKWGVEVIVNDAGVIEEIQSYKGNAKIPTNGRVYSGHGIAAKWLLEHAKVGYRMYIQDGVAYILVGKYRKVDSVNGSRKTDYLCVYNKGTKAPTNVWGTEVQVVNGIVQNNPTYGKGQTVIPSGGYVISGHGKSSNWILTYLKKGTKVKFDGQRIVVL